MNLNQMMNATLKKYPREIALISTTGSMTYAELEEHVSRMAHGFAGLGITKGDAVAIILRNSSEFIITYFALMRLGGIAVPINFLLKSIEIEYIIHDSGAVGVVSQVQFFEQIHAAVRSVEKARFLVLAGDYASHEYRIDPARSPQSISSYNALIEQVSSEPFQTDAAIVPDDVAMYIYTSGTTGKPKGVMLTHRNLLANAESCVKATGVNQKDHFICVLPMFHSFAWLVCVLLPLYIGASIIIIEAIKPFGNIMKAIFQHKITLFVGVPQIFSALSKIPFFKPLHIFIPIRLCISGAAPLPPAILTRFQEKFKMPLLEGYGLTETSPVVSLNPIDRPCKAGSIGVPIPGVEVKVINDEGKDITAAHAVGELCVRGDNVMKGYHHHPEETKAVLSDDGWLKTGDMGYFDTEGYIFIVDRKKDLIITKGMNVYPKEVEDCLMQHPAVLEAAVIGVPHEDGDETVAAFITLKEHKKADSRELIAHIRTLISSYKVPRQMIIIDQLPKNSLGKVLKTVLREEMARRYPKK